MRADIVRATTRRPQTSNALMNNEQGGSEMAERRMRYEVAERRYGCKLITGGINNPLVGLRDFPRSIWTRITPRPLGLARSLRPLAGGLAE